MSTCGCGGGCGSCLPGESTLRSNTSGGGSRRTQWQSAADAEEIKPTRSHRTSWESADLAMEPRAARGGNARRSSHAAGSGDATISDSLPVIRPPVPSGARRPCLMRGNGKAIATDGSGSHGPSIPESDEDSSTENSTDGLWDWADERPWFWDSMNPCKRLVPFFESKSGGSAKASTRDGEPLSPRETWYRNQYEDYVDSVRNSMEEVLCGNVMAGDCNIGDPCSSIPPCVNEKSLSDFWALDFDAGLDRFNLEWAAAASKDDSYWEHTLFRAAIALLMDNNDIIRWLEFRLTGEERIADFLGTGRGRKGFHAKFTIRLCGDPDAPYCTGGFWTWGKLAKIISIFQGDTWTTQYVAGWKKPSSNPSGVDRLAIAIDLAGTLLHELVHGLDYNQANGDKQGECFVSYILENMFRWAMYTRYPEAQQSTCRGENSKPLDHLWGWDNAVFPSTNCHGSTANYDLTPFFAVYII